MSEKYLRASQACAVLVMLVSAGALVGWFTGSAFLKGLRADYIPMAPNTAVVFFVLAACSAIVGRRSRFRGVVRVIVVIAAFFVVVRMSEFLTSLELRVDHWLFRFPAESIGLAPTGKMAFPTASTFLVLSCSLFLFTWPERPWARSVGRGLSVVVAFVGIAFCLGYLSGSPLMYGGRSIPMALNTALCFLLSGSGLFFKSSRPH